MHDLLLAHGAAHDDLGRPVLLADLPHGVEPAHVRHHHVHQYHVGLQPLVLRHSLFPVRRFADHFIAGLLHEPSQHHPREDRVIAQQHRPAHCSSPVVIRSRRRFLVHPLMQSATCESGNTTSIAPRATASFGIPYTTHVASSCATVAAPAAFIAASPSAPSSPIPVRITPSASPPTCSATERNSTSALGRCRDTRSPSVTSAAHPVRDRLRLRCRPPGATS